MKSFEEKLNVPNFNSNLPYIYKGNEALENLIAIIYASFLIHLHLCLKGYTGVKILHGENGYTLFPFHRNTKPKGHYGTLNIKEGKIEDYKGPLTESTFKGKIFIAYEMNLSSIPAMNYMILQK